MNDRDEVMFLVRGSDPGKGKYGLPGGFVDQGETLEVSLEREVFEETALRVVESNYLCSFPNAYSFKGFTTPVMDAFFVCKVATFDNIQVQEGEVERVEFAKPTDEAIAKMAFRSNQDAIEFFRDSSL